MWHCSYSIRQGRRLGRDCVRMWEIEECWKYEELEFKKFYCTARRKEKSEMRDRVYYYELTTLASTG